MAFTKQLLNSLEYSDNYLIISVALDQSFRLSPDQIWFLLIVQDVQSPFFAQDYLQTLLILFIFLLYTALGMLLVYVPYYASSWPLFLCSPALPNPVRARFWFMDFCKRIQKVYKKDQKPLTSKQRQKHKLGGFRFLNVQPFVEDSNPF